MSPHALRRCLHQAAIQIPFILILTGCQSAGFKADRLPAEYRARAATSTNSINFAQVTSTGISNSILAPGDLIEVHINSGREGEQTEPILLRVADDGTINVPIVGPVPVAGYEEFEAGNNVSEMAIERGMYRHPIVTVQIKSKAVNRITVLGAVNEPGVHEIPKGGCDLLTSIAAAGGLSDLAGTEVEVISQSRTFYAKNELDNPKTMNSNSSEIQLASYNNLAVQSPHPKPAIINPMLKRIDLAQVNSAPKESYKLSDRDIVRVIPRKKEMIYVAGLVNRPGQFELPVEQNTHLVDAIALAGGRSSPLADKILIIRHINGRKEPLAIQASLKKAKRNGNENLLLTAGDTVTVEQTPATAALDTIYKFFRVSLGFAQRSTL